MVFTRNLIGGLLAELEDDIDRDKFKRLLHYSRRLSAFQNRARLVSLLIERLLFNRLIIAKVQEALEEVLEQGRRASFRFS